MKIGQSIRASEVPLTGSMKLVTPPDTVISHVVAVRAAEPPKEDGAAAVPEPEVIKKGKKEEEGAAEEEGRKEEEVSRLEFRRRGWWWVWGIPGPEYDEHAAQSGFSRDRQARGTQRHSRDPAECEGSGGQRPDLGCEVVLAKPQTFMNLSGTSVKPLAEKHGVQPGRVVLVYDELDLPWTGVRIRPKGSAAGHNGDGIGDQKPRNAAIFPGFVWGFILAIRSGMERSSCFRRCGKRRWRSWTNCSTMRPRQWNP